mgnify:CR=1 FL=1
MRYLAQFRQNFYDEEGTSIYRVFNRVFEGFENLEIAMSEAERVANNMNLELKLFNVKSQEGISASEILIANFG